MPIGPVEALGLPKPAAVPVGPVGPSGPVGPEGPVGPVEPAGPVGPVLPSAPSEPAGPCDPVGPAGPVGPVAPVGIVKAKTFAVSGPEEETAIGPLLAVGVPNPAAVPVGPVGQLVL